MEAGAAKLVVGKDGESAVAVIEGSQAVRNPGHPVSAAADFVDCVSNGEEGGRGPERSGGSEVRGFGARRSRDSLCVETASDHGAK